MRRLIEFLKRFRIFLFFIALQIVSLYAFFNFLFFPKSQYLQATSEVAGRIHKAEHEVTKYWNLSLNNKALQEENKLLRERSFESFIKLSNQTFKIEDTIYKQKYEYIPATIINSTYNKRNNFFTLDIGSESGIKAGMGVFSNEGVVGIIHYVSKNFSIVKSILTENINIDIMVEKTGVFGIMKWDGLNPTEVSLTGVSNDMKIKKWEKVVTRGGSGIFPIGIPVGMIKEIKNIEGEPRWDIRIKLSNDFRKLRAVYVIKNLLFDEQKEIEAKIEEELEDE